MPPNITMQQALVAHPTAPNPGVANRGQKFDASKINNRRFAYNRRLERVRRFVEQHYDEPLPLERVAEVAGLERSYFSRYFHEKIGVCYHDWLHWIRINQAIELMHTREMSVTEIAFAVGYQDLRTFERAFGRCTGQCPTALKKEIQLDLCL